jgi:hypothetical protein
MRTLNVSISDIEFNKFGLKNEKISVPAGFSQP